MDDRRGESARRGGGRATLAAAVALAIHPAPHVLAQERAQQVEKIEVTGSRIPSPNLASSSPIAVLGAEDIRREGALPLERILASLPQVVGEQGGSVSNGASGTSTLDLRGLGSQRSLVLVNGRRLPAGSPNFVGADLNQVPAGLIRRVDVFTGGASAVYGSDAIAGVVNFILNDRFEGVQADAGYSFHNHRQQNPGGIADIIAARAATNPAQYRVPGNKKADGESVYANLLLGGNFANGKGNATVFFGYREDEALLQSERDFSACPLTSTPSGFACGGSPTGYPGLFLNLGTFGQDPTLDPRPPRRLTLDTATGAVRNFNPAADFYNFAPTNYYQRPTTRYNFSATAGYALAPDHRAYAEFSFHDDRTVAQIAESGFFGVATLVPWENPLLNADWRSRLLFRRADGTVATGPGTSASLLLNRRNYEGGGRQSDLRHTSLREVLGAKGTFAEHWDYDAYFQTSRVAFQQLYRNDFSLLRGRRALDVVADPTTGTPVCRSVLDGSDPACVPYNLWALGGVTPAALDYLQVPGIQQGETGQDAWGFSANADLGNYDIRLPWATGGAEIALGFERRRERLERQADAAYANGDLAGQRAQPSLSGSYAVREIFGELRLPVTDFLRANASYRYSDYDTGRSTDTFGVGFELEPAKQVRLRGSFQRAIRAANIIELFQPQVSGGGDFLDPCEGASPNRSFAECARTGVTAAQYGRIPENPLPMFGVGTIEGGNPRLAPETAKTTTLGAVFTPMRALSVSIDYWRIALEDAIATAGAQATFDLCMQTGDSAYCGRIYRDRGFGTLWLPPSEIDNTLTNLSRLRTSGYDLALDATWRIDGGGAVTFAALGTYLVEFVRETFAGSGEYDCAGYYAGRCERPLPEWRHRVRATWSTPWNVDLSATWRYMGRIGHSGTSDNPLLSRPVNEVDRVLGDRNYLDIAILWNVDKRFSVRAGVSNLLDRDPPVSGYGGGVPQFNGNAFAQSYDALGRRVWLSLAAKF